MTKSTIAAVKKPAPVKKKRGVPTKYDPNIHPLKAWVLGIFGKVNKEIAAELSISTGTLAAWQNKHPEFLSAVQEGKAIANAKVVKALYNRAVGYKVTERKVIQNPDGTLRKEVIEKDIIPDVAAIKLWVLNRDPDNWHERIEHTGGDGGPVEHIVKILKGVTMEDL